MMRLTLVRRFPFRTDRTGARSGTGRYGTEKTGAAWHIMRTDVRLPVAQGQGMRSPTDEHHPNRTTFKKAQRLRYIEQTILRDIDILFLYFPVTAFVWADAFDKVKILKLFQVFLDGGV